MRKTSTCSAFRYFVIAQFFLVLESISVRRLVGLMSLPRSTQRCKQEHWENQLIPSSDCGPRREADMMGRQDRDQASLFYELRFAESISEIHFAVPAQWLRNSHWIEEIMQQPLCSTCVQCCDSFRLAEAGH